MPRVEGNCWKCGAAWSGESQPGRADECAKCQMDLRSCMNCVHHDVRYHNECRIPETEIVRDRERANFCEQFALKGLAEGASPDDPVDKARKRLDKLFGG
ncbi:MAG: hypothetical protein KC931_00795 [Candidatus Omnitrophica bacterium]|nr:hypothetical protein [Candidatus Omnitrophota bacterium]MCA9415406.1 hypothetical protein [Candidatus Omnitrophota bacterium]MCA9425148.1 hypothetical protein [Candidatus Omnitrophota bacterium]MCA9429186.1 hypothetical protein [Candidatus Omnitrophota bacterium]MCA9435311.1 hypothetical protein [Candidatus Omnitrophota bacterium]